MKVSCFKVKRKTIFQKFIFVVVNIKKPFWSVIDFNLENIYIYIERERESVCKIFCSERILKENIDFYKKSARTSILSEYKKL